MKRKVYHPPASALPPGFKFPKAYLDYVTQKKVPDLDPWFFMCFYQDYYDGWLELLKEQFPDRQLVPFAKWDLNDDVACFEPSDDPDLPGIHYIHSFTAPGYEERDYCATFEEWLAISLEEAHDYQSDEGYEGYEGYDDDYDDDDDDDDDEDEEYDEEDGEDSDENEDNADKEEGEEPGRQR